MVLKTKNEPIKNSSYMVYWEQPIGYKIQKKDHNRDPSEWRRAEQGREREKTANYDVIAFLLHNR